jgi:membrane-bound serine protease (ClpP class)
MMWLTRGATRLCAVLVGVASLWSAGSVSAQPASATSQPVVYVIPINGMIDMGLAPFVQRVLDDAFEAQAAAVVLEINTFGGRIDAAVSIRDALLGAKTPTVAFINRRAISAGALIALASTRIVMTAGGTIGAAMPVMSGQPGGTSRPVDEKTVSYVRKEFRATADSRQRPPLIAEAMVDADVAIPDVIEKGKLLTLTTTEALAQGVANAQADDITALLAQMQIVGARLVEVSPNWGERVLRLITQPLLASLLLSVAMLGILIELRTPGFGIPGALGLGSLGLLLGGHWIVQLVGMEELLLVGIGISLLAVEVLVLPGFGIAGILGIAAMLAGVTMGLVGQGATTVALLEALVRVGFAVVAAVVGVLVLLRFLPRLPFGRQLTLDSALASGAGFAEDPIDPISESRWIGEEGVTTTPLRPAGLAEIAGERVDVVSEGEMIESGIPIVVCRVDGNRIVVCRHRGHREETSS